MRAPNWCMCPVDSSRIWFLFKYCECILISWLYHLPAFRAALHLQSKLSQPTFEILLQCSSSSVQHFYAKKSSAGKTTSDCSEFTGVYVIMEFQGLKPAHLMTFLLFSICESTLEKQLSQCCEAMLIFSLSCLKQPCMCCIQVAGLSLLCLVKA